MAAGRILAWPGSYNVRDLGGLPTADGRVTRLGSVIRSESPAYLTDDGWSALVRAGVRTTIDLRSTWEVDEGPYRNPTSTPITCERVPLEEGLLDDEEFLRWAEDGRLATALYFAPYLERWPGRAAAALRSIGSARPGGVLFHCERGRDRTGLIALLLLSLVGVPHEVIVADHLLTDAHLVETGVALGHVSLEGEDATYARFRTDAETVLLSLLDQVDVTDLLRSSGAAERDIDQLRSRLLT